MNKDQIMRAVESASPEQLEKIAAIVGTEPVQVPVTQRHVGCVVHLNDAPRESIMSTEILSKVKDKFGYEGFRAEYWFGHAFFPDTYHVPITHRWSGGEQPVTDDVLVLVQWSDGDVAVLPAGEVLWRNAHNILGYTPLDVIGVEDES